jgi:tetratricopeptide (TPR) repeat protein
MKATDESQFDSFREQLWKLYSQPLHLVGGVSDTFRGWRQTRRWLAFVLVLPVVLFFIGVVGVASLVRLQHNEYISERYIDIANRLVPVNSLTANAFNQLEQEGIAAARRAAAEQLKPELDGTDSSDPQSTNTDPNAGAVAPEAVEFEDPLESSTVYDASDQPLSKATLEENRIILSRVVQLNDKDVDSIFRLVLTDYLLGQPEESEDLLEKVAPNGQSRYAPAHAWRAAQLIMKTRKRESVNPLQLMHHLDEARNWRDISPTYLIQYATLLVRYGQAGKALSVVKQAAERDSKFQLEVAKFAKLAGQKNDSVLAAEKALAVFSERLGTEVETEADRVKVSVAELFLGRPDQARKTLEDGIALAGPGNPKPILRRQLSEILRSQFNQSVKKNDDGSFSLEIDLLIEAAEVDPLNPGVGESVASLTQFKLRPPAQIVDIMRSQVAEGQATATTYMILANAAHRNERWDQAIGYWEQAVEKDSNNLNATNNLAVAITRHQPERIDYAIELIEELSSQLPPQPELLDSYGEILMAAGEYAEAITKLEQSLALDKSRINTRERLANAYDEIGLNESADVQRQLIQALKDSIKETP